MRQWLQGARDPKGPLPLEQWRAYELLNLGVDLEAQGYGREPPAHLLDWLVAIDRTVGEVQAEQQAARAPR